LMINGRIIKCATRLFVAFMTALVLLSSLPATVEGDGNPVDLKLGGEGATSWNIGNVSPGDSGTKTVSLHNAGPQNGFVAIWISNLVSSEGDNPESETGNTAEPGELHNYLLFNISCSRLHTNISLPTTTDKLPHSASDPDLIGWDVS